MFFAVYDVYSLLRELFSADSLFKLRSSRATADRLYLLIEPYANPKNEDFQKIISEWDVKTIADAAKGFETAITDELPILPSYIVTPKGAFSVDSLTLSPIELFPADLLQFIPQASYDVEQAGKCLAFEAPTAVGFHLNRVNEAVLRVYWDVVTNNAPHPRERSMGVYLRELKRRRKGDSKTKATLTQIKDLDRNSISHPERNLTMEEAIDLYGIIRSSVSRMLSVIRTKRQPVV